MSFKWPCSPGTRSNARRSCNRPQILSVPTKAAEMRSACKESACSHPSTGPRSEGRLDPVPATCEQVGAWTRLQSGLHEKSRERHALRAAAVQAVEDGCYGPSPLASSIGRARFLPEPGAVTLSALSGVLIYVPTVPIWVDHGRQRWSRVCTVGQRGRLLTRRRACTQVRLLGR